MQADKPSEIRFAQEGITLNIFLVASLGASVLKIRLPSAGTKLSHAGNTFVAAPSPKRTSRAKLLTY